MADDDLTATPERNTRRRPWWAGRVEVREILELEAGNPAARPSWPRPAIVRGVLGGPAQRRRETLPMPPRRERPPNLEAFDQGEQLYGASSRMPAPTYRPRELVATANLAVPGEALIYRPPPGRLGRIVTWGHQVANGAAGGRVSLIFRRAGVEHLISDLVPGSVQSAAEIVVESGDELAWVVTAAGAGQVTFALAVQEQR